jgi:alpha-ketoglutarate-dependent taurine dioxygenase
MIETTVDSSALPHHVGAELHETGLPLFLRPSDPNIGVDEFVTWFEDHRAQLERLAATHGAVVLRNFPVSGTVFERLVDAYPAPEFGYVGGATPRQSLGEKVFEATKHPPENRLPLHQEMAYLPYYPRLLAFFCNVAAATGGETIIGDMRSFSEHVPPAFADRLREHGVRYSRNYRAPGQSSGSEVWDHYHREWPDAMGTVDPDEAERLCRTMGMIPRWEANGSLSLIFTGPGYVHHPVTGEEIWFNQLLNQSYTEQIIGPFRFRLLPEIYSKGAPPPVLVSYGDSTPFEPDVVDELHARLNNAAVAFPWEAGDVMLVDNYYTAHGRNPYTGARDVRVALIS